MKNRYKIVGNEAHIYFRKEDGFFVIDKDDIDKVSQSSWYKNVTGYPSGRINGKHITCHQLIKGKAPTGLVIDHINRNKLDNRKCNLRYVTGSENNLNRNLPSHYTGKGGNIGIYPRDGVRGTTYRVAIHNKNNKTIHIGSYKTLEKAREIRNLAFELLDKGELTPLEINNLRKSRAKK